MTANTQPQAIYLKDYRVPNYLIDKTELRVELEEEVTQVIARLSIRRNPEATQDTKELVLDGADMVLRSVTIDGRELTDAEYRVDDEHLTLLSPPVEFLLETRIEIKPQLNLSFEGLYKSRTMYCTQCEAEGFRKITYYLDRPDVMSEFTTTILADRGSYPILLSNGNLIASGEHEGGRHWATWEDPFPKPSYLFALVAGDLCLIQDSYTTLSGRTIDLRIYVEPERSEEH